MSRTALRVGIFLVFAFLAAGTASRAQLHNGKQLVEASLIADTAAAVPGQTFQAGLLLKMAPGWHTYWKYAGDAGLPTRIQWALPEGVAAGDIEWPLPEKATLPGDIVDYAYKDEVLLIVPIHVPENFPAETLTLKAQANWLVCEDICVPGSAELELTLPTSKEAVPANAELFNKYRSLLPHTTPPPFDITWEATSEGWKLNVRGATPGTSFDFFPLPGDDDVAGHVEISEDTENGVTFSIPWESENKQPAQGVLTATLQGTRQGWFLTAQTNVPESSVATATTAAAVQISLWQALFYGFLGGLILNLMPCVLPVISLKIFGFVRQAGDEPRKILLHGLAFVAGIFVWFLGLATVVAVIRASGGVATWAFQFQNPWFNLVIITIVFVFALNLFGVFEIVLPGRAGTMMDKASARSGLTGSFFQGVFATLLATPCTAPFLGTALGFAFTRSTPDIFAMFAAVALGMAAPYFLLSAKPQWLKFLPKPGLWMERVKQLMGFPLMATLVWLLFVLGRQKGLDALVWTLAFLVCIGLACWIYGAFCQPHMSRRTIWSAILTALVLIVVSGWYFIFGKFAHASPSPVSSNTAESGGIAWVPFSQQELQQYLAEGKPVFLDFTADWCLTCKVNERTVLETAPIRKAIEEYGIVPMKADWTKSNPEIADMLLKFGRVGVPFYLLYPAGNSAEPIILPELLTEGIVLDAFRRAANRTTSAQSGTDVVQK